MITRRGDYPEVPKERRNGKLYAWIGITGKCNLDCIYCYANSSCVADQHLELNEIEEILTDLAEVGSAKVMISGGEPCLYDDLPSVLKLTRDYGHQSVLVTNGTLFNDSLIRLLSELGIQVQVSIDSINWDEYHRSRGSTFSSIVIRNIDRLLERSIELSLSCTLTIHNVRGIKETILFALSKGIEFMHIAPMVPVGRGQANQSSTISNWYEILSQLYELQKEHYLQLGIDLIEALVYPLAVSSHEGFYCNSMGGRAIEIDADGTVYYCGYLRDFPPFILGNIRKTRLVKILDKANNDHDFPAITVDKIPCCRTCRFRIMCCGGCRVDAFVTSRGNILARPSICAGMQQICSDIVSDFKEGRLDAYIEFLRLRNELTGDCVVKYM